MTGAVQIATSTFSEQGKGGILDINLTGDATIIDNPEDKTETGLFSTTNKSGQGGSLNLQTTGNIILDGGRILTRTLGDADAGSLTVTSTNLQIINGGQVFSGIGNSLRNSIGSANGMGNGGDIKVFVTDTLSISGIGRRSSGIFSETQIGKGNAGFI